MTLTPSVRAISLCSFPRVANSFARASFVAISALECLLLLAIAACIRSNARRVLARITSLQLTLINMRVGVMWYRASHARRLWQTEHTAGGTQEGKNETASRGGGAGAEEAKLRGRGAWGQAADSSIARCTRPSAVRHSTQ